MRSAISRVSCVGAVSAFGILAPVSHSGAITSTDFSSQAGAARGFSTVRLGLFHSTAPALNRGMSAKGPARRLNFDERAAKRAGKTKEEKAQLQEKRENIAAYVETEFPDILEGITEKRKKHAQQVVEALSNLGRVLEKLDVPVQGKSHPLAQLASIVRINGQKYEITPHKAPFTSPLLVRLSRVDDLTSTRDGNKITVTAPPMSLERRMKAVEAIKQEAGEVAGSVNLARTNAISMITDAREVPEDLAKELTKEIDEHAKLAIETFKDDLEELEAEILRTGLDDEETE